MKVIYIQTVQNPSILILKFTFHGSLKNLFNTSMKIYLKYPNFRIQKYSVKMIIVNH